MRKRGEQVRFEGTPWMGIALLGLILGGCQTAVWDPQTLPPQLMAQSCVDIQDIDLALLASATSGSEEIHPGDTLSMLVVTGAQNEKPEEWKLRVTERGIAEVPLVGDVQLAGYDLQSAQSLIRDASIERGVFRRPHVTLTLDQRRTNRITVVGGVNEPGGYDLPAAQSDLMSALIAAGGLAPEADAIVEIRHANPTTRPAESFATPPAKVAQASHLAPTAAHYAQGVTHVDLLGIARQGQPQAIPLRDGDIVSVGKKEPKYIHVIGLVSRPDRFEIQPGETVRVLDALALAGGLTTTVADKVLVTRQGPANGPPVVIELSLRKAKRDARENLILAEGDVLSVEETAITFALGTLRQVVRVAVNGSVSTL